MRQAKIPDLTQTSFPGTLILLVILHCLFLPLVCLQPRSVQVSQPCTKLDSTQHYSLDERMKIQTRVPVPSTIAAGH